MTEEQRKQCAAAVKNAIADYDHVQLKDLARR